MGPQFKAHLGMIRKNLLRLGGVNLKLKLHVD